MRMLNTLVTSDLNVASERTNGSLSVPGTLVADTFTGSIQTHKQNKYTQPTEDARKHTGFNAARSAHVPYN